VVDGQSVPVGVGIPTIKVDRLTVGGTAEERRRRVHAVFYPLACSSVFVVIRISRALCVSK
jgi:hypothetical protein